MAQTTEPAPAPAEAPAPAPPEKRKTGKIKRVQIGLNVILQILILTAIVIGVNYVSFRHFKRWDFSRSQKFALSSQTRNLLSNLQKPVKAIIFFNNTSPMAGEIYSDVLGLLKEYEYASKKKLSVEIVDPYRNITRAKDLAAQYKFGASESILILDYEGKSKFINASEMVDMEMGNPMMGMPPEVKGFKGESAITSTLLELVEEKQKKVYLVAGHGEPDLNGREINLFREYVKRQAIQLDSLKLGDVDAIPEDATALLIFGPRADYSELEVKRISDFWMKKGRLFIMLNPDAKTARLNQWLSSVGVVPKGDWILRTGQGLALDANQQIRMQRVVSPNAVGAVPPGSGEILRELAGIDTQFLGRTTSLTIDRAQEQIQKLRFTTLVEAGTGTPYWGETEYTRGDERMPQFDPGKDTQPPLVMGVAVEQGAMADPRVKVDTGRMVVFGNGSFLTDEGLRVADINLDIGLSALNWLLNREQTVGGIPPKEKKTVALTLTEPQLRQLALSLMLGIPGVVGLFGLATWWSRRN